jgi:EEF1A lysine methyltransferase 1
MNAMNVFQGSQLRKDSIVLDFDKQWESDPGFVFYDFNAPDNIPDELRGSFEGVLIDPPFITPEVWEKYAKTAKLLLKENGKIICTTISGMSRSGESSDQW